MDKTLLDLSYLYEVSENDSGYIREVISIFLDTVPDRLAELELTLRETDDFLAIEKQAHFLKSSANIIRINDMHDSLSRIELLASQKTGKAELVSLTDKIVTQFREALPLLLMEEKKHKMQI